MKLTNYLDPPRSVPGVKSGAQKQPVRVPKPWNWRVLVEAKGQNPSLVPLTYIQNFRSNG